MYTYICIKLYMVLADGLKVPQCSIRCLCMKLLQKAWRCMAPAEQLAEKAMWLCKPFLEHMVVRDQAVDGNPGGATSSQSIGVGKGHTHIASV